MRIPKSKLATLPQLIQTAWHNATNIAGYKARSLHLVDQTFWAEHGYRLPPGQIYALVIHASSAEHEAGAEFSSGINADFFLNGVSLPCGIWVSLSMNHCQDELRGESELMVVAVREWAFDQDMPTRDYTAFLATHATTSVQPPAGQVDATGHAQLEAGL